MNKSVKLTEKIPPLDPDKRKQMSESLGLTEDQVQAIHNWVYDPKNHARPVFTKKGQTK